MRLIDLYYRAFRALRKHTEDDSNSQKLRKVISHSNHQNDILTSIKYECEIEVDWIENIEEGLIYVEKAIREDRQFIRTEGEVVPIEKVKRVSKSSVEHLSRHSDLITREPKEKADLIPDKLYVVEKLNDYLVYENRFIYMLLCYLKNFIQMRLDNIRDKTTSYQSQMKINKEFDFNQQHLKYQLNYNDKYKNDPYLIDQYKKIPMVDRVETIYAIAVSLLQTPLMREVAKAPVIKPPVIKTNVLRMNQNFRASLKLYDYITSYNKDGYMFKEIKKTFNPFPVEMSDEIAETIQLTSVISYIVGNDIKKDLEKTFEINEKEQQDIQNKKTIDEIKRLKKRIVEMNEDPAKYILKLEKRNVQLEKDSSDLVIEKEKNITLLKTIDGLENDKLEFETTINNFRENLLNKDIEIGQMNQKYFDDMTYAEEVHQSEIKKLKEEHVKFIEALNKEHAEFIAKLTNEYETKLQDLMTAHAAELQSLISSHAAELQSLISAHAIELQSLIETHESERQTLIEKYETQYQALIEKHATEQQTLINTYEANKSTLEMEINQLTDNINHLKVTIEDMISNHKDISELYEQKIDELETELKCLDDEKKYASAQYLALKMKQGLITEDDDFTSKQKFKELELEMIAYKKLFKEQWKKTKVKIREKVKQDVYGEHSIDDYEKNELEQ